MTEARKLAFEKARKARSEKTAKSKAEKEKKRKNKIIINFFLKLKKTLKIKRNKKKK